MYKRQGGGRGTVQLWQAWARVEASLGQRAHAERLYERACKYYPRDAELPLQWGKMCAAEAARLRAALAAAEVGVDPIDAREAAAAEDDNEEAAGEAPLGAAAARGEQMGVARAVDELEGRAGRLFARAVALPSATPYTFQCAASLEEQRGKPEAARALFEKGVDACKGESGALVRALHAWAAAEWRAGELRRARALFERAQEAATEPCGWLLQWHAQFEADCGRLAVARHYYARAVNAQPLESSAWRLWADLEEGAGNAKLAETLAIRAREADTEACLLEGAGGGGAGAQPSAVRRGLRGRRGRGARSPETTTKYQPPR